MNSNTPTWDISREFADWHIISFIGRSNSGKTASIEKLVRYIHQKGDLCLVLKHIHRDDVEFDTEGKNTWSFSHAGAELVGGQSGQKTAFFLNLPSSPEITIKSMKVLWDSIEKNLPNKYSKKYLLLEGYRSISGPKILCVKNQEEIQEQFSPEIILISGSIFMDLQQVKVASGKIQVPFLNCLADPGYFLNYLEKLCK